MSTDEKLNVLRLAECSKLPKADVLKTFNIPESTFYRRQRKSRRTGRLELADITGRKEPVWNQLLESERQAVLLMTMEYLNLSSQELWPVKSRIPGSSASRSQRSTNY